MATDEERIEVATRLRDVDQYHPFALLDCIYPGGPYTGEMMMRALGKLADLIEQEPESACRVLLQHYSDIYGSYYVEMSCGCRLETRDKPELCLNFCPKCGLKVVFQ